MASVIISSIERILISIAKREGNVDICSEYRLVVLRALIFSFFRSKIKTTYKSRDGKLMMLAGKTLVDSIRAFLRY